MTMVSLLNDRELKSVGSMENGRGTDEKFSVLDEGGTPIKARSRNTLALRRTIDESHVYLYTNHDS